MQKVVVGSYRAFIAASGASLLFKKCGGRVLGFNVSLVIEEVWVVGSGI